MKNQSEDKYSNRKDWLKWGPYLSERQWGTVREDYSEHGEAWDFFPHDHARSKVYRWGEDGIAGISDDKQRLCFALSLWNGKDPILKERLFGLTGSEGNHGEDVKELYYYLDNTPNHTYMKHLYKYPLSEYPYNDLVQTNKNRSKQEKEYEILDTGIFNESQYFDVFTEYAKDSEEDILIKITVNNRATETAEITVLPTLWFRNFWSFGLMNEKPNLSLVKNDEWGWVKATHEELGEYNFYFNNSQETLFTENETNTERLYHVPNPSPFVKDAFHANIINQSKALADNESGTKFAPVYRISVAGKDKTEIQLRLSKTELEKPFDDTFEAIFITQQKEANDFYEQIKPKNITEDVANIQRQAFAGMLWSKQYYNLDIPTWLNGDKGQIAPPANRKYGRNSQWATLNNEDIISMPDKWEYPWYAAWDLAFHCVTLSMIDAAFAKNQLLLLLREWYMHPNGQIPAYEWAFGDVNPPVTAWSCLQVFNHEKAKTGVGDTAFLRKAFHKLSLNFIWWVNRKDVNGNNVFEGGFLGLDNIGVFDRSAALPENGRLEQADGTAWMAMYCLNMLEIALELTHHDDSYEEMAIKFFEHFVYIAESLNKMGNEITQAWDEKEGFFYDVLTLPDGRTFPIKVRSLVGLSTIFAVLPLQLDNHFIATDFMTRLKKFTEYRAKLMSYQVVDEKMENNRLLLSLISKERLQRLLQAMLDENEFLSAGGIRSISKIHQHGYQVEIDGNSYGIDYEPAESSIGLFGGNSNWRGPVWMPMNFLLVYALRKYHAHYGDDFQVECPTGSGNFMNLNDVANELANRLISIFQKDKDGRRAIHSHEPIYQYDANFKDLVLFYEYFHGDSGRGVGASHQTGWTGVVAELIDQVYQ